MGNIKTSRYDINFKEISKGGPGGYESTYLTSEGDEADEELYELLNSFKGTLLPAENRIIRQRNGSALVKALRDKDSIGIASGFKPSGAYHFGHKLTSNAVSFFQKNGAQIFVPVADLECMLDTGMSKESYEFWAADNLIDWGANGVNLDAAHVYLQSEEFRVSNIAYLLARGLTFDLAVDTYGFEKMFNEFPFLFAGMTQVADIALPQHNDFENYHSFMVSGQDQDGHMKMTVELVKRALESGIELPGIKSIPSAFYIPHIRGLQGKASSSKPEGTLYLGPGPNNEDIEERINSSISKIDNAISDKSLRENLEKCALDMVRYIDFFNKANSVNFPEEIAEITETPPISEDIDAYLMNRCKEIGQNNVQLIRDLIPNALREHQQKRQEILNYAIERSENPVSMAWDMDNVKPTQPAFWEVPERAKIDESKRNKTQWFDIVHSMKDKIIA